jgi:hypothetical protein
MLADIMLYRRRCNNNKILDMERKRKDEEFGL